MYFIKPIATSILSLVISATLVFGQGSYATTPPTNSTRLVHHLYPFLPYYLASAHLTRPDSHPGAFRMGLLIKIASAMAMGEKLSSCMQIVEPNSSQAHAVSGVFLLLIGGKLNSGPYAVFESKSIYAAGFNELGIAFQQLCKENNDSPFSFELVTSAGSALILYGFSRSINGNLRFLVPAEFGSSLIFTFSSMLGTSLPVVIWVLSSSMAHFDYRHTSFLNAVAFTSSKQIIDSVTELLGRGETQLNLGFCALGLGLFLMPFTSFEPRPMQFILMIRAMGTGMMMPLAFDLVSRSNTIVSHLSWN